ncbi:hypothetical protein VTJ83DRAFT_1651 [Remersonia thermophila]|uniref:Cytochrome P450 n=1 Tax=Remersonia thermophila TaxID=72144 RepID=A0ABR4DGI0_9PEZI
MTLIAFASVCLSVPLSAWALLCIHGRLFAGANHVAPLSSHLLLAAAALCLVKLNLSLVQKHLFSLRARKLGCSAPPVYPHKDPLFGLDSFVEGVKAVRGHGLIDLYQRRFQQCGPTYYQLTLGTWTLMTHDADNIKAILGPNMDDWPIDGPRLLSVLPVLGPGSIFSSNGGTWRAARALLRPHFARRAGDGGDGGDGAGADLACFRRHVDRLLAAVRAAGGAPIDAQALLLDMTMDSSTDFLLGRSTDLQLAPSAEARRFVADFEYASHESAWMARLGPALCRLPHPRLRRAVGRVRGYIRRYVERAREATMTTTTTTTAAAAAAAAHEKMTAAGATGGGEVKRPTFLDELLRDEAPEEYVVDQVLSILLAGRDTTASALSSVLYFLARAPEAVEKLRREIQTVREDEPSREQLKQLRYLNNVIREALRLFSPVPINARSARRETVLPRGGGPDGRQPILVPKGTPVRWSTHAMHRDKAIWGPDADEFRPERWEGDLRPGWEYIPFSGGPRICLGQQFALMQIAYTIFRLFREFQRIDARDSGPLLIRTNLTACFPHGCWISLRRE